MLNATFLCDFQTLCKIHIFFFQNSQFSKFTFFQIHIFPNSHFHKTHIKIQNETFLWILNTMNLLCKLGIFSTKNRNQKYHAFNGSWNNRRMNVPIVFGNKKELNFQRPSEAIDHDTIFCHFSLKRFSLKVKALQPMVWRPRAKEAEFRHFWNQWANGA